MNDIRAGYQGGSRVAVAGPGRWLLIDLAPDHETVHRCWEAISQGRDVEDLLDVLVAGGLRSVPSFAMVFLDGDAGRLVVRGDSTVALHVGGEVRDVAGADAQLWIEEPIPIETEQLVLATAQTPGRGAELPMAAGVVLAAAIHIYRTGSPVQAATGQRTAPSHKPAARKASSRTRRARSATPAAQPETIDIPAAQEPLVAVAPALESAALETEEPVGASYDHLFGATGRPVLEEDLLEDDEPFEDNVVPPPAPAALDASPPDLGATMAPLDLEGETLPEFEEEPSDELIDALPWERESPPPRPGRSRPAQVPAVPAKPAVPTKPAPTKSAPTTNQAAVDRTTDRAALLAELPPPTTGPTVLAGQCPGGHFTPAHSASCRICGREVPVQDAVEITRPPLGVLRLSTGDEVTLDRGVLIGRAPSVADGVAERPHLVRVSSPENDVSRSHAEIVLDGWHVLIRDLGSTNGTAVTLPGQQPVRLRDGDLQLLEDGAVVVLADEISCTFEVVE